MFYCIAYDISNDRLRRKVRNWCKQTGLRNVQKSVFLGASTRALISELEDKIKLLLAPDDKVNIIALDKATYKNMVYLGAGMPADIAADLEAIKQKFRICTF